ncbi:MAG: 3-isopropylmalate dehydratase small subunit [Candidatus Altiarchaeota archaeon]|nr:3-isopropylmalate dehydratase small subunit [Candidatus Altiarchaeota archaeon]
MEGKSHKFGDDVNTDYIISGRYKFKTLDNKELARHVMEDLDPDFYSKISGGDFMVAGRNFGCGSSREQAPLAIKYAGISAVIAKSFARIFYRNAINVGLPVLECMEVKEIREGDVLNVNLKEGVIRDETRNLRLNVKPLPDVMLEILEMGGLANYFRKHKSFLSKK